MQNHAKMQKTQKIKIADEHTMTLSISRPLSDRFDGLVPTGLCFPFQLEEKLHKNARKLVTLSRLLSDRPNRLLPLSITQKHKTTNPQNRLESSQLFLVYSLGSSLPGFVSTQSELTRKHNSQNRKNASKSLNYFSPTI